MTSSADDVTTGDFGKRYPSYFEASTSIQTYPSIKFRVTRFA